jgi:hypothetical protein
MEISIKTDFAGQMAKSAMLKNLPRAFTVNMNQWASETIRYIQTRNQGGGGSFMSFKRPPTEALARLRYIIERTGPDQATVTLGTGGYVGLKEVVYARIQDEGGTIKAIDKFFSIANIPGRPRVGPFLTIPLGNTKGSVANYKNTINIRAKSGNFLVMQLSRGAGSSPNKRVYDPLIGKRAWMGAPKVTMKPLFLLKRQVTLGARRWFSGPINQRKPELDRMMSAESVLAVARAMRQDYVGMGG